MCRFGCTQPQRGMSLLITKGTVLLVGQVVYNSLHFQNYVILYIHTIPTFVIRRGCCSWFSWVHHMLVQHDQVWVMAVVNFRHKTQLACFPSPFLPCPAWPHSHSNTINNNSATGMWTLLFSDRLWYHLGNRPQQPLGDAPSTQLGFRMAFPSHTRAIKLMVAY